jgi:hypothetical protein
MTQLKKAPFARKGPPQSKYFKSILLNDHSSVFPLFILQGLESKTSADEYDSNELAEQFMDFIGNHNAIKNALVRFASYVDPDVMGIEKVLDTIWKGYSDFNPDYINIWNQSVKKDRQYDKINHFAIARALFISYSNIDWENVPQSEKVVKFDKPFIDSYVLTLYAITGFSASKISLMISYALSQNLLSNKMLGMKA